MTLCYFGRDWDGKGGEKSTSLYNSLSEKRKVSEGNESTMKSLLLQFLRARCFAACRRLLFPLPKRKQESSCGILSGLETSFVVRHSKLILESCVFAGFFSLKIL